MNNTPQPSPSDRPTSHLQPPISNWQSEAAKWQAKAEEHLNGWKRAKADYLNLKKDSEKQLMDIASMAQAGVLLNLLPIVDHLRLAIDHIPEAQRSVDWIKGVINIKKEFDQLFDKIDLKPVDTTMFNPELHEAVAKEKRDGVTHGTILHVMEMGYTLDGKIVKHAKVKVAE